MKPMIVSLLLVASIPVAGAEPRSGYEYLGAETRAMQDDDFANPGMLWLDYGRAVWKSNDAADGSSCATCHGEPETMRGASTRYPRLDSQSGGLINLEGRINRCRTEQMQLDPLGYESEQLLALVTLVAHQSRGLPMEVEVGAILEPFLEEGRRFYYQRRGQLDLSCAHCHEDNVGKRLRGDVISQGQINGFPIYRLTW
ncbi:MAG: sulfur oxidation c-type cytochrome SoxA, partial [Gammaproteobacteria bacterium]